MKDSWRSYLLMVSLAANVFAAGAGLGGVMGRDDPPPPRMGGEDVFTDAPPRLFRQLEPHERRALRLELAPLLREGQTARREVRDGLRRATHALRQESFDPDAFRAAMRDVQHAQSQMRLAGADAMTEIIARLPAEKRAQLADAFESSRRGRAPNRRREP